MRDLGVIIDNRLGWNKHIQSIVAKSNRVLWLLKRALGYDAPPSVSKQLYLSFVRSLTEYCPQVWGGTTKHNIMALERVQRSATRFILGFPDNDYRERLEELDLLPLTFRRELLDVCFLYKCLNSEYNVDIFDFVTVMPTGPTRSRCCSNRLNPTFCRTEGFRRSYFNRVVHTWNLLPEHCRLSSDSVSFKENVGEFFRERFQYFNADNACTWSIKCLCPRCN
jgi:hypothetical protein